ncbi:hypothetical protein BGZ68_004283, partial [Mortierella alpina]
MLDYEILDDTAWLASAPAPSDNSILQARLKEAAATHHPYHENVSKNLRALLQYGLVVLVPDSSKHESLASYIARTLLNFSRESQHSSSIPQHPVSAQQQESSVQQQQPSMQQQEPSVQQQEPSVQ